MRRPCTLRSLRGWSIPAGVMDELAFYRLEGQADSDVWLLSRLEPPPSATNLARTPPSEK